MLEVSEFQKLIEISPLISIDFILQSPDGRYLLGKRNNKPAKSFYFVPGGRIFKNETISTAMERISKKEIGYSLRENDLMFRGIYEQFYDENFFDKSGVNTHYIAIVYRLRKRVDFSISSDEQHEAYTLMTLGEIKSSSEVHSYCRRYFE